MARMPDHVPTFTAYDRTTGRPITVDERTFDPETMRRTPPAEDDVPPVGLGSVLDEDDKDDDEDEDEDE